MSSANRSGSERAVLNAALRHDFLLFLLKVFSELCPGSIFEVGWYLAAIAYELERISNGDIHRLIVTIPPRHLKSITISIAWVAWWLGKAPEMQFICVSYSNELAAKHSRDFAKIIQSEWYREVFPNVELSRCTEMEIETTAGGGRLATSVGGTLTGRGGDVIIIDDPMKAGDAASEVSRRAVEDWTTSTLFSRLNDKATGALIVVMQRLHEDDLVGHLLERGGWHHLNLPAICDEEQHIPLVDGTTHVRQPGEVLQPGREPLEILEQIRRDLGTYAFSAQYQQAPVPAGGTLVKSIWLKRYEVTPQKGPGDLVAQSWDTASKDGTLSDYSVCVTALVRNKTVYVLKVFRARLGFPDLLRAVQREAELYRPDVLLVEDAASGQQLIQTLQNEPLPFVPSPIACRPEGDKVTRLSANCALIEAGELVLPADAPWLADFEREILAFPNGKHDDQADALSQLLTWVRNRQPRIICAHPVGVGESYWIEDSEMSWYDERIGFFTR